MVSAKRRGEGRKKGKKEDLLTLQGKFPRAANDLSLNIFFYFRDTDYFSMAAKNTMRRPIRFEYIEV